MSRVFGFEHLPHVPWAAAASPPHTESSATCSPSLLSLTGQSRRRSPVAQISTRWRHSGRSFRRNSAGALLLHAQQVASCADVASPRAALSDSCLPAAWRAPSRIASGPPRRSR
eukprot:scaffold1605_cov242-Pinguiococcus_pyrenoidosus.AAC.6